MSHILHLDSSPRADRSVSRTLAHEFVTAWIEAHPGDTIAYRDLGHQAIPHVTESWIAAAFSDPADHTPELKATISLSDELIAELFAADRCVMSIPLYNFSVPSVFKAYLDQIVRAGQTYAHDANGFTGLVKDKKILVITAQGGIYRPGTPMGGYNFHEPYLRAIFGFLGITDVSFIYADGLSMGDETRDKSLATARAEIQAAIATW
jgi:FMN-dependent NADH-azoreductase